MLKLVVNLSLFTLSLSEIIPSKRPRPQNVKGNLFVDESCIDCDVCRWICPTIYGRKGIKAAVIKQPSTDEDKLHAYSAMISCPVGAIRTVAADPIVKQALDIFPSEVNKCLRFSFSALLIFSLVLSTQIDPYNIPGIFHLGYHSHETYGATPYLVTRKDGNIMIDTPRFNERLAKSIERLGDLKFIIITHQDDIGDHDKLE